VFTNANRLIGLKPEVPPRLNLVGKTYHAHCAIEKQIIVNMTVRLWSRSLTLRKRFSFCTFHHKPKNANTWKSQNVEVKPLLHKRHTTTWPMIALSWQTGRANYVAFSLQGWKGIYTQLVCFIRLFVWKSKTSHLARPREYNRCSSIVALFCANMWSRCQPFWWNIVLQRVNDWQTAFRQTLFIIKGTFKTISLTLWQLLTLL